MVYNSNHLYFIHFLHTRLRWEKSADNFCTCGVCDVTKFSQELQQLRGM